MLLEMKMKYVFPKELENKYLRTAKALWPFVFDRAFDKNTISKLMLELGCSRSTLFRDRAKLKANLSADALVREKRGPKPQCTKLSDKHELLIQKRILEDFLNKNRITPAELLRRLLADFQEHGLEPISRGALKRRINTISPRDLLNAQCGAQKTSERFDLVNRSYTVTKPLEVIQIDHTTLDLLVLDKTRTKIIGRPNLTIALDVASRGICGMHLTFDGLSIKNLMCAFHDTVMPKNKALAPLKEHHFPFFGIPELVHTDNGVDFCSKPFEEGLTRFGIKHFKRPIRKPNYGGHVERIFSTINDYVHSLPGSTKSNTEQRRDVDVESQACLNLSDVRKLLESYIGEVYHRKYHDGINMSPAEYWENYWSKSNDKPRIPSNPAAFKLAFLPQKHRKLSKWGINFKSLQYRSKKLQRLYDQGTKALKFKYNPEDIRTLYGLLPSGEHFEIHCVEKFNNAISLSEWNAVKHKVSSTSKMYADCDLSKHYNLHDKIIKSPKKASIRLKRKLQSADQTQLEFVVTPISKYL